MSLSKHRQAVINMAPSPYLSKKLDEQISNGEARDKYHSASKYEGKYLNLFEDKETDYSGLFSSKVMKVQKTERGLEQTFRLLHRALRVKEVSQNIFHASRELDSALRAKEVLPCKNM